MHIALVGEDGFYVMKRAWMCNCPVAVPEEFNKCPRCLEELEEYGFTKKCNGCGWWRVDV